MQDMNLCTLTPAAPLIIRQDSLASVRTEPRCPGLSALLGIKHLTMLETAAARSLSAGPRVNCLVPLPGLASQPAPAKSSQKGGGTTENEAFVACFMGFLFILDLKIHLVSLQ